MILGDKKEKLDTNDIMNILNGNCVIKDAFNKIGNEITNPDIATFLSDMMDKYEKKPIVLIQKGNLSKSHVYQILNGTRIPNRNLLIRICFTIGLSLEETQRLLTISQRGALYPRVRRDAAIIFCMNNHYTLEQTNDLLEEVDELPLFAGGLDEPKG